LRKKPPTDLAASIHQRLLNLSREKGEDFNLTLTRYAAERLLFRLSRSKHADRFVLKGAMLIAVWTEASYRPTRDLDFLGRGNASEEEMRRIFSDLCRSQVEPDGLEFDPDGIRVTEIREEQAYPGQRVKVAGKLKKAAVIVQADIGFGDVITPGAVEIEYPTLLEGLPRPRIRAYSKESVIAEKLQAMIALGMSNSRMKDFYDVFIMGKQFGFDGPPLKKAIAATFQRRQTPLPSLAPLALSEEFFQNQDKIKQWKAFLSSNGLSDAPADLQKVISSINKFLLPPLQAASGRMSFKQRWPRGGPWNG